MSTEKLGLIVMNDDQIIDVLEQELREMGFHPLSCKSALEAFSYLDDYSPDITIVGQRLEGNIPGTTLIDDLKESWPMLKIILMTGERELPEHKADGVIEKPIANLDGLKNMIHDLTSQ